MKTYSSISVAIFGLFVSAPIAAAHRNSYTISDITDIVIGNPDFSTLVSALDIAGLVGVLTEPGPFTVFAPTNDGFGRLPAGTVSTLTNGAWALHLQDLLLHHVVAGKVDAQLLTSEIDDWEALNEEDFDITSLSPPMINGYINIVNVDIRASNGLIHVIDGVMLPPSASSDITSIAADEGLSTLLDLVALADLTNTLATAAPITLLAPNNTAFEELDSKLVTYLTNPDNKAILQDVLKYHVVPSNAYSSLLSNGAVATLQGENIDIMLDDGDDDVDIIINDAAVVIDEDELASNGVIHVIDKVLIPPSLERAVQNIVDGA